MATKINYEKSFREALDRLPSGNLESFHNIVSGPAFSSVSAATVKKHFGTFIDKNPVYLSKVTGFYPKPETILTLVEHEIGKITESRLDDANVRSSQVVDEIARPIVSEFIRGELSAYLEPGGNDLHISVEALTKFLMEDFSDFVRRTGNGLVSIAGRLNEMLLIRAMTNGGMREKHDFTRTGTRSNADIVVHSRAGAKDNLAVEVKSYHARERLLRGLQDINAPKVGAGFFKDASEFNPGRTETLLQAEPAAIYMPRSTLKQLHKDSRIITTTAKGGYGSLLYRPLERFVTDMRGFNENGGLPHYLGDP